MDKTTALAQPETKHDKAAPAPEEQTHASQSLHAPHAVARAAADGLPPSNGMPAGARAAGVVPRNRDGAGASTRARMMGALQRTVGNARAVEMLAVQREVAPTPEGVPVTRTHGQPPHPDSTGAGEAPMVPHACPACEDQHRKLGIQAKLAVNAPGDSFEQEADHVAERVSQQSHPAASHVSRLPSSGSVASRQSDGAQTPEVDAGTESRIQSPGNGRPLPSPIRKEMEPHLGSNLSHVRVHDDATARADADRLNAKAFTHGSNIWIGSAGSADDRRLMAHELTHVVQQTGTVQRMPAGSTMDRPAPAPRISRVGGSMTQALPVQRAWYNFSIPFTDYEFDPSIAGIKTAAGIVKDKAEAALDWIVDEIKGLVNDGIDWLKEKWAELEEFASSAFDAAKDALINIVGFAKNPLGFLADAIMNFDAQGLERAWALFSGIVDGLAKGFKAMTDGVLGTVNTLWGAINRFASWVLDRISSLTDNFLFRKLPDALQRVALNAVTWLKSTWEKINNGWNRLLQKVQSWIDSAIDTVFGFVKKVLSFGINVVIAGIVEFGKLILFLKDLFSNPQKYVDLLANRSVAAFAGVEGLFAGLASQYLGGSTKPAPTAQTTIQRAPAPKGAAEAKTSASWDDIGNGIAEMMGKKWREFKSNPLAVVKQLLIDMIFPMIGNIQDIVQLFRDIGKVVSGPLSAGSLQELWTSILKILDIPILIYHAVVSILMRSLMVPLIVATFIPHPLVKAIAAAVGYGLLGAFVQAEMLNLGQKLLLLKTGLTIKAEKKDAYNRIADSLIALAMAAVITLIMLLLHFIANVAKGIFNFIKGKVFEIEPAVSEAKGGSGESKGKTPESPSDTPETVNGKRVLGKTRTADGHHELSLTEDGRCIHCSPGCADLEAKYPEELKQTGLQDKLNTLKPKEAKDPSSILKELEELESKLAEQRAENLKTSKSESNGSIRKIDEALKSKDASKKLTGTKLGEFNNTLRELKDKWSNASKSAEGIAGDPELEGVAKKEFDGIKADADKLQSEIDKTLNPSGGLDLNAFYEEIRKLPPAERVAKILEMADQVAEGKGFVHDSRVSTLNGRTIYVDPASGDFYSVDTQHGTFEHCSPRGAHIEEVNFSFETTDGRDPTGNHDIKVQ